MLRKKKHLINSNQNINISTEKRSKGKKISFGSRYFDNVYYNDEEEQLAKYIATYKVDRDWPKGLTYTNKCLYEVIGRKASSDMEYHDILLGQIIQIPPEPPERYRNYDKWFNTKKYQSFKRWDEYNDKIALYNKMRKLINYLRLENIKLEAKRIEREIKLQMQSAFIKSKLFHNYISIINKKETNNLENNKKGLLPNAIMLEGTNRDENVKTIKWLTDRCDTNYIYLDYNPRTEDSVNFLAKIESALETAQNHYKQTNGQRTTLYINNFDYLLEKGNDTADIKNMIQQLCEEYKTTLIFETADSTKLEPVALQDHRFGLKYILKEDIEPKAFKELEHEFFKSNTTKIANGEGYRFNYLPGKNKFVDLFLGSFGYDKQTLWLEGKDLSDIEMGCTFIDSIKELKMFKLIERIQTKSILYSDSEKFLKAGFKPIYEYTKEHQLIWQKLISQIK